MVTTIFHGKQKHLKNTVAQLFPKPMAKHFSEQMMMEAGLGQMKRAIDLDMNDWARLCNSYMRLIRENPSLARYQARPGEPSIGSVLDDRSEADLIDHDSEAAVKRQISEGG